MEKHDENRKKNLVHYSQFKNSTSKQNKTLPKSLRLSSIRSEYTGAFSDLLLKLNGNISVIALKVLTVILDMVIPAVSVWDFLRLYIEQLNNFAEFYIKHVEDFVDKHSIDLFLTHLPDQMKSFPT